MGSFTQFLTRISDLIPGPPGNIEALSKLDPSRIYVENVRSILEVSEPAARLYCDTAVRQGLFVEYVEVICPDGHVAWSAPVGTTAPPSVPCFANDADGHLTEVERSPSELRRRTFYRLVES